MTAYEVLSDEKKRSIYDQYGEEGLKQHDAQQQQGQGGFGGFDMFNQFFGGGFGGGFGGFQQQEQQKPRGHDVIVDMPLTLEELYVGKKSSILRDKVVMVEDTKDRRMRDCNCRQKLVQKQVGPNMIQQFTQEVCDKCPQFKWERNAESIQISIDPGEKDGEEIVFYDEGEPAADGDSGDLKIVVREIPHAVFKRDGNNLKMQYTISLSEALTGFKHEVAHLDGHTFFIESKDR